MYVCCVLIVISEEASNEQFVIELVIIRIDRVAC